MPNEDSSTGETQYFLADTFTARIIVADYDTTDADDERTFFSNSLEAVRVDYADAPGRPRRENPASRHRDLGQDMRVTRSASVTGWNASPRIDPDGTVTDRIEPVCPSKRAERSMPAFGGDDRTTLFVTTIGDEHGRPATPGRDGVRPGSLLAIEGTGATGIAETPFGFSKQAAGVHLGIVHLTTSPFAGSRQTSRTSRPGSLHDLDDQA